VATSSPASPARAKTLSVKRKTYCVKRKNFFSI
jgi:hypothetical protein